MSSGRILVVHGTRQGPGPGQPAQDAVQPRMRWGGQPAAAYTWHVAASSVLVIVDLDRDG